MGGSHRRDSVTIDVQIGKEFKRPAVLKSALTRIGSHPRCELRLSDAYAPPYLVTIERKDGEVWIHNTSGQVIQVGNESLVTEGSRLWHPGEATRLNSWVTIDLVADQHAIESPRIRAGKRHPTSGSIGSMTAPAAAKKPGSRDVASFLLSAVLLILLAWLVLDNGSADASGATGEIARLVQLAHGSEPARGVPDQQKANLCLLLQSGRAALIRGDLPRARYLYGQVRDTLLAFRTPDGHFEDPWYQQAFSLVRDGLNRF